MARAARHSCCDSALAHSPGSADGSTYRTSRRRPDARFELRARLARTSLDSDVAEFSPRDAARTPGLQQPIVGSKVDFLVLRLGGCWAAATVTRIDAETGALQVDFLVLRLGGCWAAATVTRIDAETGALQVDLDPGAWLPPTAAPQRLRARTRPGGDRLASLRALLRGAGAVDAEATRLFRRHAREHGERGKQQPRSWGSPDEWFHATLGQESLAAAGAEIDELLGSCGSSLRLERAVSAQGSGADRGRPGLSRQEFTAVFLELVLQVLGEFGEALDAARCRDRAVAGEFLKLLGEGAFGAVYLAKDRLTGAHRAVKKAMREDPSQPCGEAPPEVEHMRLLDHPHVAKLYEHYADADFHYIAMDFCAYGELAELVATCRNKKQPMTQSIVGAIMRQAVAAIAHAHAHGVVHLDVKGRNILLAGSAGAGAASSLPVRGALRALDTPHVMLVDFGIAAQFRPGYYRGHSRAGSLVTMAPEVARGTVTPQADIFSLGCVLYEMCTLEPPFLYDTQEAMLKYWKSRPGADLTRFVECCPDAPEAEALCSRLLRRERRERPSAAACLSSGLLAPQVEEERASWWSDSDLDAVRQLMLLPERSLLYRSVALTVVRSRSASDFPSARRLFLALDASGSGVLGKEVLTMALHSRGLGAGKAKLVAEAMDFGRDGTVSWSEFAASCVDLGDPMLRRDMEILFAQADADEDGRLRQGDLARLLLTEGCVDGEAAAELLPDIAGHGDPEAEFGLEAFLLHFADTLAL